MNIRLPLLIIATLAVIGSGCNYKQDARRHVPKKEAVNVYKLQTSAGDDDDPSWLYYYVIFYNNSYIYSTSPTYYTSANYSSLSWQTSKMLPAAVAKANKVDDEEVDESELGEQADNQLEIVGEETDTAAAPASSQVVTPTEEENIPTETPTETTPSEGSGESGGGDSGGGDSGGGDGGGGGD
jgi:uncharacterized membrane protein YgcG